MPGFSATLIGGQEANAADVARQTVWVLADERDRAGLVGWL